VRQLEAYHRAGEVLSRMAELFQSCSERGEAYAVVRESVEQLFPDMPGAFYIYRESRDLLEEAANWSAGTSGAAPLAPDDCWALRLGRPHFVPRQGKVRCRHAPPEGTSYVCMPVQGQGQVLGMLHLALEVGVRTAQPAAETQRRLRALTDRIGPALANLRLRDALREMALRDTLTGLYNRRYLDETLVREQHRAERGKKPVSIVMIDIDHFKRFNDGFGHAAGDAVLGTVGRAIARNVRASDLACRYGGEEIAVVLFEADLEGAVARAEKLRAVVKESSLTLDGKTLPGPTASFGVATFPLHGATLAEVMKAADQALYRAKQEGRDRVCAAEAPKAA
jgi:diguanylate cyclase (GGDEF)-like protein